jgi:sarcosine oxidase subunit beta
MRGDDIEWHRGGYSFVAYREREEKVLKDLLKIQQKYGLDINWLNQDELLEVIPDLNQDGLIGGTFSPRDGSASPLKTAHAFFIRAREQGAEFRFRERVTGIIRRRGKVVGVRTDKGGYATEVVINAAGPWARSLAQMAGLDVPVVPDSHEAGITEPVAPFLGPMVVDIRPAAGSRNYYFYQHRPGPIVFCITPEPPIVGTDRRETSEFLPMIGHRMVDLVPKLANIKVRRTWRGLYPMSPDGFPIVGRSEEVGGYIDAVGMCGQGYMLGPGMGDLLTRLVQDELTRDDEEILEELSPSRDFGGEERLK